MQKIPIAKIFW